MLTWEDISVLVKCVPHVRQNEVRLLTAQFHEQSLTCQLIEGKPGEHPRDNFRRLLLAAIATGREWFSHVEDDAYLAPDFAPKVVEYIRLGIANIWTFYSSRKEDLAAFQADRHWRRISPGAFANSQCVVMPTCFADAMLRDLPEWESQNPNERSAVDYFIGWFCRRHKFIICASVPSLVQHRQIPSTLGHRKRYGRISRTFALRYGPIPGEEGPTAESLAKPTCR